MIRESYRLIAVVVGIGLLGSSLVLARANKAEKKATAAVKERAVTIDEIPKPVKRTILKQAGKHKIREIEEITRHGRTVYEAEWVVEIEITVAANGKLLSKEIEAADDEDDEHEADDEEDEAAEEEEKAVTLAQVPNPVKKTILKQAGKHKVKEIEKVTEDGKTVFEAEWVVDGKEIEIVVAPNGKLLGKEVEEAEEEDEEDDD